MKFVLVLATGSPTIHVAPTVILLIVGLVVLAAVGAYFDERHRARRGRRGSSSNVSIAATSQR